MPVPRILCLPGYTQNASIFSKRSRQPDRGMTLTPGTDHQVAE